MLELLRSAQIDESLASSDRQYLSGDLERPQVLDFLRDAQTEVGMSFYREFKVDIPHYHTATTEYSYLISGELKHYDIDADCEHHLRTGDYWIIRPGSRYIQKARAGTRVIFFKYPAGDDKVPIPLPKHIESWCASW